MGFLPELLAPAGNLEKLKLAINYGADACYLGLQKFGLRSAAENFSVEELFEATKFAHSKNAKVFVVLNAYLHDKELTELPEYLKILEKAKVDAVIVSDLGVVKTVLENSSVPVHLSTQASCLNTYSAKLWKKMGVERIVLGREISIDDAKRIKDAADIEIEMFIHGSMCMAYSGNCVISNYTQGRDSNRGGCAHSCRFQYELNIPGKENKKESSFFMSSKDLNGLSQLPKFIEAGIDSLKVEGRMKNHLYVSTVSGAYRAALDEYDKSKKISPEFIQELNDELKKLAHRDYTSASLVDRAGNSSVYRDRERAENSHQVIGKVLEKSDSEIIVLSKGPIQLGEEMELVNFDKIGQKFTPESFISLNGESVEKTKPNRIYKIKTPATGLSMGDACILRKPL